MARCSHADRHQYSRNSWKFDPGRQSADDFTITLCPWTQVQMRRPPKSFSFFLSPICQLYKATGKVPQARISAASSHFVCNNTGTLLRPGRAVEQLPHRRMPLAQEKTVYRPSSLNLKPETLASPHKNTTTLVCQDTTSYIKILCRHDRKCPTSTFFFTV